MVEGEEEVTLNLKVHLLRLWKQVSFSTLVRVRLCAN